MKKEWIVSTLYLILAIFYKVGFEWSSIILHFSYLVTLVFVVLDYKSDYFWETDKVNTVITIIYKNFILVSILFAALDYPGKSFIQGVVIGTFILYGVYIFFFKNNSRALMELYLYQSITSGVYFVGNCC